MVVGTGSSGIQCIPEIAKIAKSLTVLQRTPQYTLPANNHRLSEEWQAAVKRRYSEIRQGAAGGFAHNVDRAPLTREACAQRVRNPIAWPISSGSNRQPTLGTPRTCARACTS